MIYDYRTAKLSPADRALCDFATKLTLTPGAMTEGDIAALKGHGFTEGAISVASQVCGYFNYINRIADALNVDPEAWMKPSKEEWLAQKGRNYLASPVAAKAGSK
ncbi:MAG: hypothetical protein L6Q71_09925 [Planctomycetes bacterium]|nr:hypothetical protein [Planctomycetota bacterium]NUQ35655.1 hypothetical protein [Planctomycetaceae bacterium]